VCEDIMFLLVMYSIQRTVLFTGTCTYGYHLDNDIYAWKHAKKGQDMVFLTCVLKVTGYGSAWNVRERERIWLCLARVRKGTGYGSFCHM
jgi:hypothetical protein